VYVTAALGRHDPRSSRIFEDHIRSLPQVISAVSIAGETDYLLSIVARDVGELQQVLVSLSTRGGQRLVTYLVLGELKAPAPLPLGVIGVPAATPRPDVLRSPVPQSIQGLGRSRKATKPGCWVSRS